MPTPGPEAFGFEELIARGGTPFSADRPVGEGASGVWAHPCTWPTGILDREKVDSGLRRFSVSAHQDARLQLWTGRTKSATSMPTCSLHITGTTLSFDRHKGWWRSLSWAGSKAEVSRWTGMLATCGYSLVLLVCGFDWRWGGGCLTPLTRGRPC
eukprot:scaffold17691_cov99-Isochrysis_galbana.AAC.1